MLLNVKQTKSKLQEISEEDVFESHLVLHDVLQEKEDQCSNLMSPSPTNDSEQILVPLNPCDLLPASTPHASALLDLLPSLLPPDSWLSTHLATTLSKVVMSSAIEQLLQVSTLPCPVWH